MDKPRHMTLTTEEAIRALEDLVRSPGWQLVKSFGDLQVSMMIDKYITKSIDPNLLLRTGGAIDQTKTMIAWPELQLAELKRQRDLKLKNKLGQE